jgi:hypothetical protein
VEKEHLVQFLILLFNDRMKEYYIKIFINKKTLHLPNNTEKGKNTLPQVRIELTTFAYLSLPEKG